MARAASFPNSIGFPRPFAALANRMMRAFNALRSLEPVPCWTEYLRATRD
ncbi:hypothetical protein [Celeribacter neptunius]|uniref:Uncharacterized protein n=1 Tax=Celeribacter neptunius TaxID=588602 RepID=A0A1I3RHC5_9RHOB|nr:hypothetical protein [Celeribacter neptunius]SFJ44586.1 hypothetical protein SAMN04487991_2196 [Celeribacter neptunius]